MNQKSCPYCHLGLSTQNYDRHVDLCICRPEMLMNICYSLREVCTQGVICSRREYDRRLPSRFDLPRSKRLVEYFGSWDKVADFFSLMPESMRRAVEHAEAFYLLNELSCDLHNGEIGPTRREFDHSRGVEMIGSQGLCSRLGDWDRVLSLAGLEKGSRTYYSRQTSRRLRKSLDPLLIWRNILHDRLESHEAVVRDQERDLNKWLPMV